MWLKWEKKEKEKEIPNHLLYWYQYLLIIEIFHYSENKGFFSLHIVYFFYLIKSAFGIKVL